LIIERNNNWVPQIENFIGQNDNYFIVVGALHLVGKKGVVELLKAKGHKISQM